jgi:hypothetical protein
MEDFDVSKKFIDVDGEKFRVILRKVKEPQKKDIERSDKLRKARNLRGQNKYRENPDNLEKIRIRQASYYEKNKENIRAQQKAYREKKKAEKLKKKEMEKNEKK